MGIKFKTNRFAQLDGRLYTGNLSEIQYKIETAMDLTETLIIDLNSLKRIDKAGAYMLYLVTKKANENNKEIILLCTDNEFVKFLLSFLGISFSRSLPNTNI